MKIQQRLQLGAAAVIANSLLALSIMSPRLAHAATCAPIGGCVHGCDAAQNYCASLTPTGCTLVSATCPTGTCGGFIVPIHVTCTYQ